MRGGGGEAEESAGGKVQRKDHIKCSDILYDI